MNPFVVSIDKVEQVVIDTVFEGYYQAIYQLVVQTTRIPAAIIYLYDQ
jgi:hypothetical protein|uniref:Uncharacterized protein n=1 Tax=Picea glauca TaxID=3330 RepID=A0A101M262_PICGL|nr:hypothetical protein ABT39_MTgene2764 [Picea glauca]